MDAVGLVQAIEEPAEIIISQLSEIDGVDRVKFYQNYAGLSNVIFDYLEMSEFGLAETGGQKFCLPFFIRSYFTFFSPIGNWSSASQNTI